MATEIGSAYLSILPSLVGFGSKIQSGVATEMVGVAKQITGNISDAAAEGGRKGGKALGQEMAKGADSGLASMGTAIKGAALAAGVAAGAALAIGISGALDKEKANSMLAAQLGASPQMAKEFGAIAGDLYAQAYGESIADVNDALRAVWQNGLVDEDAATSEIQSVAAKAIDVAHVMGEEYDKVTQAVGTMLRTGMAGSATEAFDIITRGTQQGVNKAQDLLDTYIEYPTTFRQIGIDGATSMGLLAQAVGAGARNADIAADALKEFSIRSIDGSKATGTAFVTLGLDAQKMAAQIAQGGAPAAAGLQTVLDKLRATKDPVTQMAAAVGLFGTKAEDMGQALFAMDPSTAVAGLGDLEGAAAKVGNTLANNAATRITAFKREVETTFVNFLGGQALPAVEKITNVLASNFGPALSTVGDALKETGGWIQRNQEWLTPLAAGIAAMVTAWGAWNLALAVWRGIVTAAIALQTAWNVVLAMNPIGLIVLAIIGLGVALVVAYKKSETFRNIVQGAWQGIQAAVSFAWNNILKPAFDGIVVAVKWVGDAAMWLWNNAIKPAFDGIKAAASLLLTILVVMVFTPILIAWKVMSAYWQWAWSNIWQPVFQAIGAVAMWLWNNVLKPTWDSIKLAWSGLMTAIGWYVDNVLKPTWNGIAAAAQWLWNNILKPVWDGIKLAWLVLVTGIKVVWETVLKPVFDGVAAVVQGVADKVGKAFDGIAGAFGSAWGAAKNAVMAGWNTIAGWVNSNVIGKVNSLFHINIGMLPTFGGDAGTGRSQEFSSGGRRAFATGGPVFGPGTATSDSIPAMLSNGEFVLNAAAVRSIGVGTLNAMNRSGKLVNLGPGGDAGGVHLGLPGFAEGGEVGKVKDWIKAQAGKPYSMGATGPGAWDCSGLVGAVWALLNGKNPYQRHFSTVNEAGFFKPGLGGPHAFNVGFYGGGGASGHTAGSLDGLNFEATPPHALVGNTNYTPSSGLFTSKGHMDVGTQTAWGWLYEHTVGEVKDALSGALSGLADHIPQLGMMSDVLKSVTRSAVGALQFDQGGLLTQGTHVVNHRPRQPDRVLNASQWKVAEQAMSGGANGKPIEINVHPRADHSEAEVAAMVSRELGWQLRT